MKVLQVIPSLEAGGAERAVIDVALALKEAEHVPLVASSGGRMQAELDRAGVGHIVRDLATKNPAEILRNAEWLKEQITKEKVDIIHARSRAPAWSAWMAARATRIPFVTTFHAAYKGFFPLKKIYNSVMAKGDRIIAISDFIASHIRQHYGAMDNRVVTIPRGIDLDVFCQDHVDDARRKTVSEHLRLEKGTPFLLMPGRLSPIKGQELVLDALAQIKNIKFICAIVGPDQGRSAYSEGLKAKAKELGLEKHVRFVSHTDLPTAYALSDLVLSPSQVAEGFGRVPVEAQAFGVPVIATALGATHETVREGDTGWLVPQGDAPALAKAIEHALSLSREQKRRMSEAAVANVRAHFDVKGMCAKTLAVYRDVLA